MPNNPTPSGRDTRPATCIDCGGARDPDREAAGKWRCGRCASAAAERRKQPPKPTLVTWCPEPNCGRSGMRKPDELLDETCRYCDAGDVRVKRFPTRTQARAFLIGKQAERARAQAGEGAA